MRQEDIITILREHGPLTASEIDAYYGPCDARPQTNHRLRSLERYGIVECIGVKKLHSGNHHTAMVWRLCE